jgi:hypothetical protein
MHYPRFAIGAIILSLITVIIAITCISHPGNPYDPAATKANLFFESSTNRLSDSGIVDSVGKTVTIGVTCSVPANLDSVHLKIIQGSQPEDSVTLTSANRADTLWYLFSGLPKGTHTIIATIFIRDGHILTDTGTITLLIKQFPLSVSATNGTVSRIPAQPMYDSGSVVGIKAIPDGGFRFTEWSGDASGTSDSIGILINAAKNIAAIFSPNPGSTYTLAVTAVNGSVIRTPDQQQYAAGATVGLKAHADPGYHFVNWSGDTSAAIGDSAAVTMTGDRSVTTIFGANPAAPKITVDPQSQIVSLGSSANFSVVATGTPAPTYQWRKNGIPIASAKGVSIGIQSVQFSDTGDYDVVVKNSVDSAVSKKAHLSVSLTDVAPFITQEPRSDTVEVGESATFTVNATGIPVPTYQWKKNGAVINSATNATFTIDTVSMADTGAYTVDVINSVKTVTSEPARLVVTAKFSIVKSPGAKTKCAGDSALFAVEATGGGTLHYQWKRTDNGSTTIIAGANASSYVLTTITSGDDGAQFVCTVSNSNGKELTTAPATLTVQSVSTAPTGASANPSTVCGNVATTLSVTGGSLGTGAVWKWYAGSCAGTAVGTGPTIQVTPTSTTAYFVRAEGGCLTTACAQANVTVTGAGSAAPNAIVATPSTICPGDSSLLSLTGGILGTGASWEWYSGSCSGGAFIGVGPTMKVKPTATTSYSVRARGDCNTTGWTCGSVTVSSLTTAPTGITAGKATICQGDSTLLKVTGGSLGSNAAWRWYTGSCGGAPAGSGDSITVAPSSTTAYFVRPEGGCNTVSCASTTITVDSLSVAPTAAAALPASVCRNGPTTLSVTGGKLGSGASWKWYTGTCDGNPIDSGASITVHPADSTNYFVRAEGRCNKTACAKVTVPIKTPSTPATVAVSSPAEICPGDTSTVTIVGGTLGTGALWKWHADSCNGADVGNGTTIKVSPKSTTKYFVRAEGDCGKTECVNATVKVKTISTQPSVVSVKPAAICPGEQVVLSINDGTLGTGANWKWYAGSCGGTSVGSGSMISISPNATTQYFVRGEGDCGNSLCATGTVTLNTLSTAPTGAVADPNIVCPGSTTTLSVSDGSLGSNAKWVWYSGSCGGTKVGEGNPCVVTVNSNTTYIVRAEGTCNSTSCANVNVSVNSESTAPSSPTVTPSSWCSASLPKTVALSATPGTLGTGAQLVWYANSCGGSPIGTGSSISVSATGTTAYYVRAEGTCNSTTCASTTFTAASTKVPAPTITIGGCTGVSGPIEGIPITISCSLSGATIYYTTGGSTPTRQSGQYTGSFFMNQYYNSCSNDRFTIKAIAVKDGLCDSDIATATY